MLARSISSLQLPTELPTEFLDILQKQNLPLAVEVSKLYEAFFLPYLYGYAVCTMIVNKYTDGIIAIETTSLQKFLGESVNVQR